MTSNRAFAASLAAVLVLAAGLRLFRIDVLPPGLAYDEAWEGLDGASILAGARPVFLTDNNGREPLFAYSVSVAIALFGQTATAVRLAATFWGIATVATMALLGGVIGGRGLALAAAAMVAVSYWPIHLSRVGLRPIALAPFEAASIALLLIALGLEHRSRNRAALPSSSPLRLLAAAAAGLTLGLGLYTYLPGRLMIGLFAAVVGARLIVHAARPEWCCLRRVLAVGAVAAAIAAIVAAPLVAYLARHPEHFVGRSDQVSVMNAIRAGADARQVLSDNLVATLGAFAWRGDEQARHNLPGRPIFDPASALLFLIGAAWLATRASRGAALTVAAWLPLMLLPAWLSDSAPHQLRALGALPPLYLIAGAGLAVVGRSIRLWGPLAALAVLLIVGSLAGRDYFDRFADPAVSAAPFDADVAAIAARLRSAGSEADAVVGPIEPDHPALRYLAPENAASSFPTSALPLLASGARPLDYYLRDPGSLARIERAFGGADIRTEDGLLRVRVPPGVAPAPPAPERTVQATFGSIELLGVDVASAKSGEELPVRLYWRSLADVRERYVVFIHLVGASGHTWAQEDLEPGLGSYSTAGWRVGQIVIDERRLPLPPGIPPGEYALRLGLVRRDSGERLPRLEGGDAVTVAPVSIERSPGRLNLYRLPLPARPEQELSADRGRVRLVGYRIDAQRVSAGRPVPLLLAWEWVAPAPDLRAEVLVGAVDAPLARVVGPVGGAHPIDLWQPGEFAQERRELIVPPTTPDGPTDVWLRLVGSAGGVSPPVHLGSVYVESRPRDFAPPAPQHRLGIRFGDFAELAGYDLATPRVAPGDRVRIRLYWRALGTADENYVVFLHLLDANERVMGQLDGPPAGGRAPPQTWVAGETIVDDREFDVASSTAPGEYRLEAGLYLPTTGRRVPVSAAGSGDRVLFGSVVVAR